MESKVKWFEIEKGFGFIEFKDNQNIFIHFSSISDKSNNSLVKHEVVEFEIVKTKKGYKTKNTKPKSKLKKARF